MLVVVNPFGPVHAVFTVTGTLIAPELFLNSTVQVRVTVAPIGRTGVSGKLVTLTDSGAGTVI